MVEPAHVETAEGCWLLNLKPAPSGYVSILRKRSGRVHRALAHRVFFARYRGHAPDHL